MISVELTGSSVKVADNNSVKTEVTIDGDASRLKGVDLGGVTGAGAYIYAYGLAEARIVATQQGDYVYASGGDDRVSGLAGDDTLIGNAGADILDGGKGLDRIQGGSGNDTITGGAGNDTIDGGADIDTAVYGGNRADYRLEIVDGSYQLTDLRARTPDGIDTIGNVEKLQFADQTIDLPANAPNFLLHAAEGHGLGWEHNTAMLHAALV